MIEKLENAMDAASRLKALLYALEVVATDIDVVSKDMDNADKAANLLYMAEEVTEGLVNSLEDASRCVHDGS